MKNRKFSTAALALSLVLSSGSVFAQDGTESSPVPAYDFGKIAENLGTISKKITKEFDFLKHFDLTIPESQNQDGDAVRGTVSLAVDKTLWSDSVTDLRLNFAMRPGKSAVKNDAGETVSSGSIKTELELSGNSNVLGLLHWAAQLALNFPGLQTPPDPDLNKLLEQVAAAKTISEVYSGIDGVHKYFKKNFPRDAFLSSLSVVLAPSSNEVQIKFAGRERVYREVSLDLREIDLSLHEGNLVAKVLLSEDDDADSFEQRRVGVLQGLESGDLNETFENGLAAAMRQIAQIVRK